LGRLERLVELRDLRQDPETPISTATAATRQSDLLEQCTNVLLALAQHVPLVLVLDDLQWADAGSVNLLFHLGRQVGGSRILVVGAYRPEEIAVGSAGERHPLESVVNEFQLLFGDSRVDLDRAEGRPFVDAFLDAEPNRLGTPFREMLYRCTRGHPLFTVELLRGMKERGNLVQDQAGRWIIGSVLDWQSLPTRAEAAIAERIGRLPQPLKRALTVGSVEGEDFTAEVVARVLGIDAGEMVTCLSAEIDRKHRLIRAVGIEYLGSRCLSHYRFRHYLFQQYLYNRLDSVERAYLHGRVGSELEDLHSDREPEITAIAPTLARHFQEAGNTEKAIHYLHQAGERAVRMSAYQEALVHLTKGLALLSAWPEPCAEDRLLERDRQELALQVSLGKALMATKGSAAPEVERAFARARELCQQTGQTSQLCRVLDKLSVRHYVRAEHQTARELGEGALSLAQQAGDPLLVAVGHRCLGFVLFSLGEYTTARTHLEQMVSFYKPQQHHRAFVFLRGSDAGTSALAYDACCLWCLGYPNQALERSWEALALARDLGHPISRADVLYYAGCMFDELRREPLSLKRHADELIRLSKENGFPTWLASGTFFQGEALALSGQVQAGIERMQKSISELRFLGSRCHLTGALGALAQAHAAAGQPGKGLNTVGEALSLVQQTGERHWEPELHRLRGELLLSLGDDIAAEGSLDTAVAVARKQRAKSWELRTATSLARLWRKQGRVDKARQLLSQVYGWFAEGFDTPDLQEAGELLEQLS
jgi:adenylate cyclase